MKNLRPETLGILQRIETLSGRPVEFKPDATLTLRATLQLARNGASAHLLRYRPVNEPLDYWVAYQAGYLLRLLELPPSDRFDFAGTGTAPSRVVELLTAGLAAATGPSVVLGITKETRARGQVTERLYLLSALGSCYSFITLGVVYVWMHYTHASVWWLNVLHPLYLVGGGE